MERRVRFVVHYIPSRVNIAELAKTMKISTFDFIESA
jgi:hypothetical protein